MCYSGCRFESYPRGQNEGCVCTKTPFEECPWDEARVKHERKRDRKSTRRSSERAARPILQADGVQGHARSTCPITRKQVWVCGTEATGGGTPQRPVGESIANTSAWFQSVLDRFPGIGPDCVR